MRKRFIERGLQILACSILTVSGWIDARADYPSEVLANGPVAYWRLNETTAPPAADIAKNLGSVGAAADGFYLGNVQRPVAGALVGSTDTAVDFDGLSGTFVNIPNLAELNPAGAFTVEFWALPFVEMTGTTLVCPLACLRRVVPDASGWIFYQSATAWNFRMGNTTENYKINLNSTAPPVVSGWQHVAAVFDGTTATLYVNGVAQASAAFGGTYTPNRIVPMGIGARGDNAFLFNGTVDEVAFYGEALPGAVLLSHYQNGVNASPAKAYSELVAESSPLGYWRLNEPAYVPPTVLPVADNGGSLGDTGDGSYQPGSIPGVPGPQPPEFAGFDAGNRACGFNGVAGYVSTALQSLFDVPTFTMIGWFRPAGAQPNRTGLFGQNDVVENGWHDAATQLGPWSNFGFPVANPALVSSDRWHFFAAVADGTTYKVILDGVEAASVPSSTASFGVSAYNFNIGGGGILDAAGNFFKGQIDEVAFFHKPLTLAQIQGIYYAAGIAPDIRQQPQAPAGDVYQGNTVILTVGAGGTPPLAYQWRKGGVEIAGQTGADLVFSSIMAADEGVYDVVVSNPYGSVTSQPVTLSVQVDTTVPVLESAEGSRSFTGVRVIFSESLDPVSAQTASNYQLSGGVTVTSATLSSPAGTDGDHIVDLVTTPQTPGGTYTLTVTGVKDQALPGNSVVAGSTATFTAWGIAEGTLLFEHYDNLSGATDADITTALQDPRVQAEQPTTLGFLFREFSTRSFFADDTHENYLARITGWITPTVTGDYNFFLRADDAARLYLSTTDAIPDPETDTPIAQETDCCDAFQEQWIPNDDGVTYPTTTEAIRLVAGQRYGVLALLKEAAGGDYLMVAWREVNDFTPAAELPNLPGEYLSGLVEPSVELRFVQQPTDQLRVLPFDGTEDFAEDDGGYLVENSDPEPPGPWEYDATNGQWVARTGNDACSSPNYSLLTSPAYLMPQTGPLTLSFNHRYAFEGDLYDGGQVRISVNRGPFTTVPPEAFSANGYAEGLLVGNGILKDQPGFNAKSTGYDAGTFITSTAVLGTFNANDTIAVQFVAGWDECTTGTVPNWVLKSLQLAPVPPTKASTFHSLAEGTVRDTPLRVHYQWQRDDGSGFVDIAPPGSIGPAFSIYPAQADFDAVFRVVASIPGRSLASDSVRLVTELGPPTIAISRTGTTLSIEFTGKLESAAQVGGPYTEVTGAVSPYVVPSGNATGFFRSARRP